MATPERIVEWLEEHDALHLGDSPWRTVSENEDVFLIDWKRLFPSERPGDRGQNDWDVFGDDWQFGEEIAPDNDTQEFVSRVRDALEGQRPSENEGPDIAERLGWDTCAWYQPMHFFAHDWGIFIRRDCIRENAIRVARFLPRGTPFSPRLLKALIRAGFAALFLHEQFHHKIESLGIRLHVVQRTCRYPRPMLPGAAPYPSISTRQLVKLAEKHGWVVKDGAGKGSHVRMEHAGAPSLTIPGDRRDVSPGVVKTALRAFGGYKLNDLAALLHRLER